VHHHPDLVGAIFFAACAAGLVCLAIWPRLWVLISVNPKWAASNLDLAAGKLRYLTAMGAVLALSMCLYCLGGR
jgi:hypothetical protein